MKNIPQELCLCESHYMSKLSKYNVEPIEGSHNKVTNDKKQPNIGPSGDEDIKNICFEAINDEFSWGKYGDFKVIIMNKNGYINVTKLCDEAGKRFENWLANKMATELINCIILTAEIPAVRIIVQINTGIKNL